MIILFNIIFLSVILFRTFAINQKRFIVSYRVNPVLSSESWLILLLLKYLLSGITTSLIGLVTDELSSVISFLDYIHSSDYYIPFGPFRLVVVAGI